MGDVFDEAASQPAQPKGDVFDQAAQAPHRGFFANLGSDLKSMISYPRGVSPYPGMDLGNKQDIAQQSAAQNESEKKAGYGPVYRTAAAVGSGLGVNVPGMEESARQGDSAGVLGHAAAVPVVMAATKGASELAPKIPAGKIADSMKVLAGPAAEAASKLPVIDKVVSAGRALGKYKGVPGELADIWQKPTPVPEPAPAQLPAAFQPLPRKPPPVSGTVDQPFQRGSIAGAMADSVKAPEAPAKPPFDRGNLGRLLNESVGAAPPPDPKAPIYQRGQIAQQIKTPAPSENLATRTRVEAYNEALRNKMRWAINEYKIHPEKFSATPATTTPAPTEDLTPMLQKSVEQVNAAKGDLPEGHTAHQSSALRSSKYDSGANEFHARMTSGDTTYVYGDVAPEEAQAFADADSKGKAYQQLKSSHPLVAKIVNGKRIAVKPGAAQ